MKATGTAATAGARVRALAFKCLPRRLGRQLQWMVALSLSLTLLVFGAYTIRQLTALALANIEGQAAALARSTALSSVEPLLTEQLDAVENLVLQAASLPQALDVAVLDVQGVAMARAARQRGGDVKARYDAPTVRVSVPQTLQVQIQHDEGSASVIAWHPITVGSHLGWVRVAMDSALLSAIRERIWVSTLAIGLASGIASLLLLSQLLAKPMRAIEQARDFAAGLERIEGQQMARVGGPEETIALGRALNQASLRLLRQRESIDDSFAALIQQEAAVTEANEQLRTIFALSPDALLCFDQQGQVSFANAALFRMTGLRANQLLGQREAVVDELLRGLCEVPDEYPGLQRLFRPDDESLVDGAADSEIAAEKQSPQAPDRALEREPERHRLTLARPRTAVLDVVGLHGESQAVSRLLYLRDITHETEVERMKTAFLHTAAHELRTPMTAIHSCVDLMRLREFEPERRRQLLDIVYRHSLALMSIVNDLLDLARLEARAQSEFDFELVELADVVAPVVADHVVPEGRAAPELRVAPGPMTVRVDVRRLRQVVVNLLSNAYKFSSQGAVCVRVLREPAPGTRVGFEVQDHGIGMTPEQLARVCERFYRAEASGKVPGSGLGMSIVKELVELMQGSLAKASAVGQGTTYGIWFEVVTAEQTGLASALPLPMPQEKSLRVEDEQALQIL